MGASAHALRAAHSNSATENGPSAASIASAVRRAVRARRRDDAGAAALLQHKHAWRQQRHTVVRRQLAALEPHAVGVWR
jgi:hypothetical protein